MTSTAVTVFIPTFNRLPLLRRAVASALQQGTAVRVHVNDNASTDGTAAWLHAAASDEPRLTFTARNENVGALRNFEDGFFGVTTPYLIPLADDDELCEGFVVQALEIAEQDPSLAAVVGQSVVVEDGKELYRFPERGPWGRQSPEMHMRHWLPGGHYITWSAILWSTNAVRAAGVIEDLKATGLPSDVWFQARVFAEYPAYVLEVPGATFVRHANQTSADLRFSHNIMRDFSHIHDRVDAVLRDRALYGQSERKRLMAAFVKRTCICARDWLQRSPANASTRDEWCMALAEYARGFAPYCGWRPCPLSPQFARSPRDLWNRLATLVAWARQRGRYAELIGREHTATPTADVSDNHREQ